MECPSWTGVVFTIFLSCGTKGQKSLHCPGTMGQQDKPKILSRDEPGQDFDFLPQDGPGLGNPRLDQIFRPNLFF